MADFREESDALGNVNVPTNSYGGSFMVRAMANFQISSLKAYPSFIQAFAWVKWSAADVNAQLGHLESDSSKAIIQACQEFLDGAFETDYQLDVYQAGAGTPYNMNLNEILANRANEILAESDKSTGVRGGYDTVHPNNHVNMAQSSNDTNPTAVRIAALKDLTLLMKAGTELMNAFEKQAQKHKGVVKVGRTHLQDAVPVTLGQEFGAYASSIRNALARLDAARQELNELGIGGSATGSGINTHPDYAQMMCDSLSDITGLDLSPAYNRFETTHSMAPFLAVSSALRALSTELLRISNDLRLMASGPRAGFNEIVLPEVEPGSSIMPGKVNPSVCECLAMICVQVMGLDHSIALAAQQGQLELNWYAPLIMWDLLHEIEILTNGMKMFTELCVDGIEVNESQMAKDLASSTAMATALAPYMGYKEVALLVNKALEENIPFPELVPEEFQKYLDVEVMTKPNRD